MRLFVRGIRAVGSGIDAYSDYLVIEAGRDQREAQTFRVAVVGAADPFSAEHLGRIGQPYKRSANRRDLQRAVDLSPDSEVIAQHLQEARG